MDDSVARHRAFQRLSEMFAGVPEVTRIPVPELKHCVIFGNLSRDAVLSEVAVDKAGRFWRHDRETDELVMFFDPNRRWRINADALTDDDYLPDFATGNVVYR